MQTNGKGVDIVLNSLSEDKLIAGIECLAEGGRFLEIGKYDLSKDSPLGMSMFLKNTSFMGVHLDALFNAAGEDISKVVELLNDGIRNGAVIPLPTTVFNEHQIEQAFR